MLKHFKDKMIEDDMRIGNPDDYIGPGVFVSIIVTASVILGVLYLFTRLV